MQADGARTLALLAERRRPLPLLTYFDRPAAFAHECIDWPDGEGLTPYQDEILTELHEHHRAAVRGPHGCAKSTSAALAVIHFALTRDAAGKDWKTPTTASRWLQLTKYLWPEIHKWASRLRWDVMGRDPFTRFELLTLTLKLRHGQAFAASPDQPASIEGAHADELLYVFDEAKVIAPAVFDAAEGAFAGAGPDTKANAYALAISTPGEPSGRFYEIHARKPGTEHWWTRHVTLEESIAAGRISAKWVAQMARQWSGAVYANRVLGDFAAGEEDGVIPLSWIEAANARWEEWDAAGREGEFTCVGVDVARSGEDRTVYAPRFGHVIGELEYHHLEDTMTTAGRCTGYLNRYGRGRAVVDIGGGLGAGPFDRLREQGYASVAFNPSSAAHRRDVSGQFEFTNTRAAAWWNLRELLDPARDAIVALPDDDVLIGDLTAPRWSVNSSGRLQIESKDDIAKRLKRSTDAGDAVVQAFWDQGEIVAVAPVGLSQENYWASSAPAGSSATW